MSAHRAGVPTRTTWPMAFVALAIALLPQPGSAAEVSWLNNANSVWLSFPSNWSNGAINGPTAADDAVFDLGVTHNVLFNISPTNNRLLVRNDDVTFFLSGLTYTLTDSSFFPTDIPSIVVGQSGGEVATLTLQGIGTLTGQNMFIGYDANFASSDQGTLNIFSGATVNARLTILGHKPNGTGTINLNFSKLNATLPILVGFSGSGTLDVQALSEVNADNRLTIASGSSAFGSVTVNNSKMTVGDDLIVGHSGTAILLVEAGSEVSNLRGILAEKNTGNGTATVTGNGSKWTNTNLLSIGEDGIGLLTIEAGGLVTSSEGFIGANFGAQGTVTLSDTNSTWNNSQNLFVGGRSSTSGGTGTLEINTGSTVSVGNALKIWEGGTVNLNGGTLTTGSLEILGAFNFSQGTLNLTNSNVTIGAGAGITGFFESTLILNPGMAVNVTNGLGDVAADRKLLINDATSSFSANGGTNDGQITVVNGSLAYTGAMTNNTKITLVDAALSFAGDGIPTSSGGNNADGLINLGTLNLVDTTIDGDVHSPSGSTINVAGNVTFNGLVSGGANLSGASTTTTFNGGYSPGDSPAEVSISGDVTFGSTNTLFLELAGTTLGTEYDHLDIGGLLSADGILDIQLLNGFDPQLGDSFDLLDFNTFAGSFSEILLPTLSGNLEFDTTTLPTDGTISVIASLPGDFDTDVDVDGADFLTWQRDLGDAENLAIWKSSFGSSAAVTSAAAVPEISSFAILTLGLLGLCRMRYYSQRPYGFRSGEESKGLCRKLWASKAKMADQIEIFDFCELIMLPLN